MIKGLGRGLNALIDDEQNNENTGTGEDLYIDITLIDPSKFQPRKRFDEESLKELSASIKVHGIIQPIIVQANGNRYTIIAGERRYRAARMADLVKVPALIKDLDKSTALELALIENIQREDINPIEEAMAIAILMEEHSITQETISNRLGKSRSAIANSVRLLTLPEGVKSLVASGDITAGHARALLSLETPSSISDAADFVIENEYSVRQTEEYVKRLMKNTPEKPDKKPESPFKQAEVDISKAMETRVRIFGNNDRGKIQIEYYSKEQLEDLYTYLTSSSK